jgi:hypothetical protein
MSAGIGMVQPFTPFWYTLACTVNSVLALLSVLNRLRFSHRQQSIHVSQVCKKVVMMTMESSGSHRVARWQGGKVSLCL